MRISEKGGVRLKSLSALLLWGLAGFLLVKLLPVYFSNFQLKDTLRQEALQATVHRWPPEKIVARVVEEARALDLHITRDQVQVEASHNKVSIAVHYTVPVDRKVYTFQLHFSPSSVNRGL